MPDTEQNASTRVGENSGQIEYIVKVKRRTPLQRLGCAALIGVWLVIMLIPLVLIILAIDGEITLSHGSSMPDRHEHPRLQIKLIKEPDYRGFQITNSTMKQVNEQNLCVQTEVRYFLWQGDGDNAQFCDCYNRGDGGEVWQFAETISGLCEV